MPSNTPPLGVARSTRSDSVDRFIGSRVRPHGGVLHERPNAAQTSTRASLRSQRSFEALGTSYCLTSDTLYLAVPIVEFKPTSWPCNFFHHCTGLSLEILVGNDMRKLVNMPSFTFGRRQSAPLDVAAEKHLFPAVHHSRVSERTVPERSRSRSTPARQFHCLLLRR